jgi:hypothetical protein
VEGKSGAESSAALTTCDAFLTVLMWSADDFLSE